MSEYIKIDKQFILTNINNDKLRVWLWILSKACDSSCVIDGVELRRGQLLLSTREMEKVLGISRRRMRTICSNFAKEGAIECQPLAGKTTIVTVNNYDDCIVTHLRPTLNTDNQKVKSYCDPLANHLQEKATHLPTHLNVYSTTSYDIERPTYQPTNNFEQKEKEEKKEKVSPHTPLYKEKKEKKEKSADTRMRVRERKDFFNSIFSDLISRDGLVNQYCKNNSISKDVFFELARESIEQLDFIGNKYESEQDAKKHIISTINNKIRIRKQNEQRKRQNILRREFEAQPADATNYDADF